jgi:hypothetical protein
MKTEIKETEDSFTFLSSVKSKACFLYTEESDSISQALHETLTDKHWILTKTSTKLHDKFV